MSTFAYAYKHTDTPSIIYANYLYSMKNSYIWKTKYKKQTKRNQLTTTCVAELVALDVPFHMCYKALTLKHTQVLVAEVIICKMQGKGTSPKPLMINKVNKVQHFC